MTTPLTPLEIIHDIHSLDGLELDWLIDGRLDGDTERDLHDKRADLMDELRTRFTTRKDEDSPFQENWTAWEGDYDLGIPVGYGATELDAIERLLELIGEDA